MRAFAVLLYNLHLHAQEGFEQLNGFAFLKSKVAADPKPLENISSLSTCVSNLIKHVCDGKDVSAIAFAKMLDDVVRGLLPDDLENMQDAVVSL